MKLAATFLLLINYASVVQAGEHRAVCPDVQIKAVNGSEVILPCHVEPKKNLDQSTLDWTKDGKVACAHRHGQKKCHSQDVQYTDRATVEPEGLVDGNMALKISSVQLSDQGTYKCLIIEPDSSKTSCTVELVVVESSGGRGDESSTAEPPVMKDGADDQETIVSVTPPSDNSTLPVGSAVVGGVGAAVGLGLGAVVLGPAAGIIFFLWKHGKITKLQTYCKCKNKDVERGDAERMKENENPNGTGLTGDGKDEEEEDEDLDEDPHKEAQRALNGGGHG